MVRAVAGSNAPGRWLVALIGFTAAALVLSLFVATGASLNWLRWPASFASDATLAGLAGVACWALVRLAPPGCRTALAGWGWVCLTAYVVGVTGLLWSAEGLSVPGARPAWELCVLPTSLACLVVRRVVPDLGLGGWDIWVAGPVNGLVLAAAVVWFRRSSARLARQSDGATS